MPFDKAEKVLIKKIKIWKYTSTRFCSEQHLGKWMHFDQRFVVRKSHSWNIFEKVVTVAYQISLETNCVEGFFLVKLHDWGSATFLREQLTALDMVLITPLSHKFSTYYYNADVCKDLNDYRSSLPEVFCKKGVLKYLQNSQESTCARVSFLIKLQACRPASLF